VRARASAAVALLLCCIPGCDEPAVDGPASERRGLVFIRVVGESTEVVRARIAEGEERFVTRTANRSERWPYWSESAQRVVFQVAHRELPNGSDLVIWDPATKREAPMPRTPRRQERWPGWSPDGAAIAFAFRGGDPAGGVAFAWWRERRVEILARSGPDDYFLRPNFSPDGRLLVTQRRVAGRPKASHLWLLSKTAEPRAITSDAAWHDSKAWFTRDGTQIIYTRREAAGSDYDIWGVPVSGDAPWPIVAGPTLDHSARPSPTRDEIVFVSNRDGSSDVFLADADGGRQRSLQRTPHDNELAPRWSPDGEFVVVTRIAADVADFGSMGDDTLARSRIAVLDRNGRQHFEADGTMADWMPAWP
jgi:Tol biopolymer transport system component